MKNNCRELSSSGNGGFTLVELMIVLAMSGIIVAAVYAAHIVQQKSYYTQGQVVEVQQNLRAALEMMSGDIRMAMYDPGGGADADIPVAIGSRLQVRMDLNDDGDFADTNEDVVFGFSDADDTNDPKGQADAGRADLRRNGQSIAQNIQAIEFYYRFVDDEFPPTTTPSAAQRKKIQSVQITLLAVSEQRDPSYTNKQNYQTPSGQIWAVDDNFRRRLLTHTVAIRNQGI